MKLAEQHIELSWLAARWRGLAVREKAGVALAGSFVLIAAMWWVGIAPALETLRAAKAAAPALHTQLQSMQAQALEAATLKAQRKLSYDESLKALELSMKTLGPGATLAVTDARATVSLRAVSGDGLAAWLAQARSNARLVPAELRLKQVAAASSQTIAWDGSVVFNLGSRP